MFSNFTSVFILARFWSFLKGTYLSCLGGLHPKSDFRCLFYLSTNLFYQKMITFYRHHLIPQCNVCITGEGDQQYVFNNNQMSNSVHLSVHTQRTLESGPKWDELQCGIDKQKNIAGTIPPNSYFADPPPLWRHIREMVFRKNVRGI